ncbi:DNA-directed RNA polymerase subunit G [Thermogladius sp. 4427co]|uniref:DNA-directed RNA polymerase subunit G n=1 Tax=Thermogladius sp. 4427co TaxID=3450718 RepID=UPI003F7ACD31
MHLEYQCIVNDIERLRYPGVYRVKTTCEGTTIEIEFHEKVMPNVRENSRLLILITDSKEECLKHYFCGRGNVVSNRVVSGLNRIVISIGGYLLVVKSGSPLDLKPLDEVFIASSPL